MTATLSQPEMEWMLRGDLPEVIALDELSNAWDCWTEEEYLVAIRKKTAFAMVCRLHPDTISGFAVYDLEQGAILLRKFEFDAVAGDLVVKIMLNEIKEKMRYMRLKTLEIVIPDNPEFITKHNFWKSLGFKSSLKKNYFSSQTQDGYAFTWEYDPKKEFGI